MNGCSPIRSPLSTPDSEKAVGNRDVSGGPHDAVRVVFVRSPVVDLGELQELMRQTYGARDAERGIPATVAWLTEELGELAQAVRKGTRDEQVHELGDVIAWVTSLANQLGIDLDEATARFADGCPKCGGIPCTC